MVETGYKPEFALGALYAGENAAAQQAMQDEELIKSFLANQRERQMQPLDVQTKQWEAASAQDKLNDPSYREWLRKGYIGQMKTQDAAGNTAQVLAPFKQRAEQSQLENEATKQSLLRTIMDTDAKLRQGGSMDEQGNLVPFSPEDRQTMQSLRDTHVAQLGSTPEHWAKKDLQQDKLDSAEYIAQLRAQQAQKQLQEPKYKEQLAFAMQIMSAQQGQYTPEQIRQASDFYNHHLMLVQAANPKNFIPNINLGAYGAKMEPPPIAQSGAKPATGGTEAPATAPPKGGVVIKYNEKGERIQ